MIKLRMVRCYRNPDWDEPAAERIQCTSLRAVTTYLRHTYVYVSNCFSLESYTTRVCVAIKREKEKSLHFVKNAVSIKFPPFPVSHSLPVDVPLRSYV